jgi:hypothetical protein
MQAAQNEDGRRYENLTGIKVKNLNFYKNH